MVGLWEKQCFLKLAAFMTCFDIIYRHVANHGYKAFEADIFSLRSFCSNVAYAFTRAKNKKTRNQTIDIAVSVFVKFK